VIGNGSGGANCSGSGVRDGERHMRIKPLLGIRDHAGNEREKKVPEDFLLRR